MEYNFDRIVDRKNTDSLKYDFASRRGVPEDVLPLWVADMDFQTPDEVIDALVERSKHGIFGYSESGDEYYEVLRDWFERRFGWAIERKWLVKTPGVVFAVTTAIRAFTEKGDGVLIQEPVYYPFRESIEINDRRVVVNELVYSEGKYSIDFDDFEQKVSDNNLKMFILCSPHNPVGRVWTKEELIRLGDLCLKHDVLVVADEIHADFIYPGHEHHVFANLKEEYKKMSITCTAPSKTFNLAALQLSNNFIPDTKKRRAFRQAITRGGYSQPNIMGIISCQAAYEYGEDWLEQLKIYLKGNLDFMREFLAEHIPEAKLVEPEGTYLVWLDVREIPGLQDLEDQKIDRFMSRKAKVWLDGGTMFGQGGSGFQRFNIACPRDILKQALCQIRDALEMKVNEI